MKFSELKNKIAELNHESSDDCAFHAEKTYQCVRIYNYEVVLYQISNLIRGNFIDNAGEEWLSRHDRLALQKLAYKYSRTPLDERENEPKFRVRMLPDDNESYLNQSSSEKNLYASNSENIPSDKTIFNKSEYDKLQQEYPEWLPKFDDTDPHFEFLEDEK